MFAPALLASRRLVALGSVLGVVGGLGLVLGCKSDRPAASAVADTIGSGSDGSVARFVGQVSKADSRDLAMAEPAHVKLPRSSGTPPRRTTRPIDAAELARLSEIEHEDFRRDVRILDDRVLSVRHTTTTRPFLGVTVTIERCGPGQAAQVRLTDKSGAGQKAPARSAGRPCVAMELAAWQAGEPELRRRSLAEALVDRPDTRFEIGARDLGGTPAIYTYQLGQFFGTDDRGQPEGSYTDAYNLYYNDSVNQIRVSAAYVDDAVGSLDQLVAIAPEEDLETLAVAFASFYVHEWK